MLLGVEDLRHIQEERGRAPLVATFVLRENGTRFRFMINHLYRSDAQDNKGKRQRQSEAIKAVALAMGLAGTVSGHHRPDTPAGGAW
jgi:hypothetical protein